MQLTANDYIKGPNPKLTIPQFIAHETEMAVKLFPDFRTDGTPNDEWLFFCHDWTGCATLTDTPDAAKIALAESLKSFRQKYDLLGETVEVEFKRFTETGNVWIGAVASPAWERAKVLTKKSYNSRKGFPGAKPI